jgi:hypothetical protein
VEAPMPTIGNDLLRSCSLSSGGSDVFITDSSGTAGLVFLAEALLTDFLLAKSLSSAQVG